MSVPTLTLNNGVTMPALGYGVFQTPPDETTTAVLSAFDAGYRHIDTAAAYGNESGVGEAIRRSGLARDELFIETKIWVSDYGYDQTLHAFEKASRKLGLDQIDLLIPRSRSSDFASWWVAGQRPNRQRARPCDSTRLWGPRRACR